ncbi:dihydroxyacetone kinase phosphotransfer subunit [Catenulispora sp. MAP5-51]|uniref:dihydroxyacetone kinase phosphoryl donor subunit DhaM n=1 Tax=Catenulispora sp. MAP5-51 TaxID=3156298 RepID=UPI003516B50D
MNQSIGIVLVSHSAHLASGLRELLAQIGSDRVPVAAAGGTRDGGIGTSYDLILAAIAEADRGHGVVILPDLGSSVLTALAVLEDHPRADVLLVDAPFVEGAVAAAVTAAAGADLAAVADAARQARGVAKFDDGSGPGSAPEPEVPVRSSSQVTLPANLHARPAGKLAQEAAKFSSDIRLEYGGRSIDPTGVLAVMSLGATLGSTVTVHAEGQDADTAIRTLTRILAEAE